MPGLPTWVVELETLHADTGELTPAGIVKFARNPKTALHAKFDWNDKSAGQKYRLQQAGELVRSATILIAVREDEPAERVRRFLSVDGAAMGLAGPTYQPTDQVLGDVNLRKTVLDKMYQEFLVFRRRWQRYGEFATMLRAVLDEEESGAAAS